MTDHVHQNFVIADYLNFFDIALIFFFCGLFLILPHLVSRKAHFAKNDQEYILMGRGLTLPLFVATLTSTWYGGIFGVTQIAYLQGIYSFFTQGLFWYVAYFIFAILLAKLIRRHQVLTLPELIGKTYGDTARRMAAVILFFHALPVTYAISVGLLLKLALGIDFMWATILGVGIVAIYTSIGGFRSVVVTDCLQFILMFLAVIMLLVTCIYKFGGIDFLKVSLPAHYFAWRGENQASTAFIWLFIACTSTFIHPVFYQRCLAAKSDRVAVGGIFIAMFFWLLFDISTTFGGMYARALLPHADSATAYLTLGVSVLPHGLRGLFLTGVLATILSTLDSFMFVSGTSFSYDLLDKKARTSSYRHPVAIIMSAIFVIIVAMVFETNFEPLWLFMEGAFSTSMVVPVLMALFVRQRLSAHHFLLPALLTLVTFFVASFMQHISPLAIEPFYLAHIVALLSFLTILKIKTHGDAKIANFSDG